MPAESIAGIEIPEVPHLGTWPITSVDFGAARRQAPIVHIHRFQSANAKIEQRFLVGPGAIRWTVTVGCMDQDEYEDLRDWFESADAAYATFDAPLPNADGTCSNKKVRFADWALAIEHLAGRQKSASFDLIEVPTTTPSYTVFTTSNRFPSGPLQAALLEQDQEIIPLVKIIPPGATLVSEMILISDRRVIVGGQLYQPRLLELGDLTQSINGNSDETTIVAANADGVFSELVDAVGLYRARVEVCFFHVPTLTLLEWWAGSLVNYNGTYALDYDNGTITFQPTDGSAELGLAYPPRKLTQLCWKKFKDGIHCPYATVGSGGDPDACNKTWEDCQAHGMDRYHGGIRINPQIVRTKDNSTGVHGFGRSTLQSSSVIEQTVYEQPLREIWTDMEMTVPITPIAVRDEGDFRNGVGIVGRGKLGAYSSNLASHHLNGSVPHDPLKGGGFRGALGTDPAAVDDYFAMSQAPWSGPSAYPGYTYCAGVAFVETRIVDEPGLQLPTEAATMDSTVYLGRGGWYWTAPGSRHWQNGMTNPYWGLANSWLEANGAWVDDDHADGVSVSQMEQFLDIESFIVAGGVADTGVPPLIGEEVSERQFIMRGIMQERKPWRDWADDIMRPCLGTWTKRFGKLRVVARTNATPVEAFGVGNVLVGGYANVRGYTPRFTALSVAFGDQDWKFAQAPPMEYRDEDYATMLGHFGIPEYTHADTTGFGPTRKSQVARWATTAAREEIGGVNAAEWRKHKTFTIKTTILAANVEAGMVISYVGPQTNGETIKGRVQQITLRGDFSMELTCLTVRDSMYQYITGPIAKQAETLPPPAETFDAAPGGRYCAGTVAPNASDPLYGADERFMPVRQEYLQGTSEIESRLIVDVRLPVTQFVPGVRATEIRTAALVSGSLPGERVYYVRVAPYTADGTVGPPSPAVILRAPTDYWDIALSNINWPDGDWAGYALYAGESAKGICEQVRVDGALPSSLTWSGPLLVNSNTLPSNTYKRARVKAKGIVHGGTMGGTVTEVTAPNKFKVSDFADLEEPFDDWVGEVISIPSDRSDGSAPVWNFEVTDYDHATGEFTVTPDCVVDGEPENSVEVDDVAIIQARVTEATPNTVTVRGFLNSIATTGLTPDKEIGLLVRIIAGTGRGQVRRIVSNTDTTYTLDRDWDVTPDTSSFLIVEEADWTPAPDILNLQNSIDSASVTGTASMPLPNLPNRLVLVGAFLIDRNSVETSDDLCSLRQIYFYGQPPSERTITSDSTVTTFDETIYIDTTADNVTLQMLPSILRQGRQLTVKRVSGGVNSATIKAVEGEVLNANNATELPLNEQDDSIVFRTRKE